jgi:RNA methyltransferase, TrmH family
LHILPLGKHNPRLAAVRKAVQTGDLTPDGLLPIEGAKLLQEAIKSGIEVLDIFVRRGVGVDSAPEDTPIYELDAATFKSIQDTETSQGIIALVRPRTFTLSAILKAKKPRIVVLGRVQDPGNVGTIVRIAESFNATGCLAVSGTASIHNPKVVRASAGSLFRLPHVWNLETASLLRELKSAGIQFVGTSPVAKTTIDKWDWRKPVAIFVGNEGGGLSEEELESCDAVLRIPQNPQVESLNSAIAAAVILYEASKA